MLRRKRVQVSEHSAMKSPINWPLLISIIAGVVAGVMTDIYLAWWFPLRLLLVSMVVVAVRLIIDRRFFDSWFNNRH